MAPGQRRKGFTSLLDKLRTVLKRKRPSETTVRSTIPTQTGSKTPGQALHTKVDFDVVKRQVYRIDGANLQAGLEAETDDDDNAQHIAEELLPVACSRDLGRAGQRVFERHGLSYEQCVSLQEEPPKKIRRVEKPIKLRVRYVCHACAGQIGPDNVCTNCGHRRSGCRYCYRAPIRGATEVLPGTERDGGGGPQGLALPDGGDDSLCSPESDDEAPHVRKHLLQKLGRRQSKGTAPHNPTFEHRSGRSCVLYPQTFGTQHREVQKKTLPDYDFETVQRVYRKPRLRIRWSCDQCETAFMASESCPKCGHRRCKLCPRHPYVASLFLSG